MGVNFLNVKQNAPQGGGEIEGELGRVVGGEDEGVGEGGGRKGGGEEGLVVDVGGLVRVRGVVGVGHCEVGAMGLCSLASLWSCPGVEAWVGCLAVFPAKRMVRAQSSRNGGQVVGFGSHNFQAGVGGPSDMQLAHGPAIAVHAWLWELFRAVSCEVIAVFLKLWYLFLPVYGAGPWEQHDTDH